MSEIISRRGAFSFLGTATALAFVVPTTLLTASNADAQAQGTPRARQAKRARRASQAN